MIDDDVCHYANITGGTGAFRELATQEGQRRVLSCVSAAATTVALPSPSPPPQTSAPSSGIATGAQDACLKALSQSTEFRAIAAKLAVDRRGNPSMEDLANGKKPTKPERSSIAKYMTEADNCERIAEQWRSANFPPPVNALFDQYNLEFKSLVADLYAGKTTYGEFAKQAAMSYRKAAAELASVIDRLSKAQIAANEDAKRRADEDRSRQESIAVRQAPARQAEQQIAAQQAQLRLLEQQQKDAREQAAIDSLMNYANMLNAQTNARNAAALRQQGLSIRCNTHAYGGGSSTTNCF
jgi:hypothetical protein